MKNILKQLEELATSWKNNMFLSAKLKLTVTYFTVVALILFAFTFWVYVYFAQNIEVDFQYDGYNEAESSQLEHDFADKARNRLMTGLIFGDLVILAFALPSAYYLTGSTLRPIDDMVLKQNRFISDSAHELRTPLAVMKTGIQSIDRDKESGIKKYKKLNKDILEETNRLIDLTNNLLFLARKNSNNTESSHTNINMTTLIERQLNLMQSYAKKRGILIKRNLQESVSYLGNEDELSRIIINLLKNAIDYNNPEGTVDVILEDRVSELVITVKDSGIGIAENEVNKIFERFYQVDKSRSDNRGGSGLGLSIVKEILQNHHGTINVISKLGEGSEFIIKFPK